jgi:hypothetical protein
MAGAVSSPRRRGPLDANEVRLRGTFEGGTKGAGPRLRGDDTAPGEGT